MLLTCFPDLENARKKTEKQIFLGMVASNNAEKNEKRAKNKYSEHGCQILTMPKKRAKNRYFRHGCQILTMPKKG